MTDPLIITQSQLQIHFGRLGEILAGALSMSVFMDVDWSLAPIAAGLVGNGCEFIPRNRGLRVPVAPLLHLRQGIWAWLGYREEWDHERTNRNIRRYSFRSAGMTIYFGAKSDAFKPQMFRAEWAGWAKWSVDYSFQAAGAGHPHWQFDALESLTSVDATKPATLLLQILEEEGEPTVREFQPQLAAEDVKNVVTAQKISRIHFASAAAWWKQAPLDDHAHGPKSAADIQNWVRRSLSYVTSELERLQAS